MSNLWLNTRPEQMLWPGRLGIRRRMANSRRDGKTKRKTKKRIRKLLQIGYWGLKHQTPAAPPKPFLLQKTHDFVVAIP